MPNLKEQKMLKFVRIFSCVLFLTSLASAQITVACAANVQFAMEEIKTAFEKEAGIQVKTIYGASGMLSSQIRNGAPYDLFVSADMSFPESLFVWKYAVEKPKVYVFGKLVLWSAKGLQPDSLLHILKDQTIQKIAIPDPKSAPYGKEAVKALKRAGLYDHVQPKLVYGENISQAAQYISLGHVDIGFNAKAIVCAGPMKNVGNWVEVESSLYDPIAQGVVALKYGNDNNPGLVKKFYAFLFDEGAKAVFLKYGYILPGNSANEK
jgi:molybdate transport system substrate-binding protein